MSVDTITGGVGFLLTIMILSYLIGDNPAFRIAVHILVGVTAGYVAMVVWWQVLWPNLIIPLATGTPAARASLAVPLLLSGMLLMKAWPPLSRLGAPAMGMLVGVASAVAIGGAVQGTLVPQTAATLDSFGPSQVTSLEMLANGALILLGVITSLVYFHFSGRTRSDGTPGRHAIVEMGAAFGGIFIAITLGTLFAGVYSAALTALIERAHFLLGFLGLG